MNGGQRVYGRAISARLGKSGGSMKVRTNCTQMQGQTQLSAADGF